MRHTSSMSKIFCSNKFKIKKALSASLNDYIFGKSACFL